MEKEVKQRHQRHRRRERAQRMQAQRESKVKDGDSAEEVSPARDKQPRPTARRKKSKEPLGEEDIIDGFAIMAFRTYEDLEAAVKCASLPRTDALTIKPRLPGAPRNHPSTVTSHSLTLLQDAGTSDDSGRASERLTGSSVAPRDPDSSRDRLSDASSRCSSGKGYICDSEGDDDKASPENTSPKYHDASMEDVSEAGTLFRVTGSVAGAVATAGSGGKSELAARGGNGGALALSRAPSGGSASPAPAPLPQPAPSPAPAALPPPALPPPPFRADTPHRPSSAHIPALDGHAATQIPAKPVGAAGAGAAGPDTPERPASNNKLQPGARAAADSPTPAPPAPPAPSPLFPSHTAYQSLAAAALPDYRHTNHETRTEPAEPPAAPLDLHAARPAHAAHAAHPGHAPHPHPPPHPGLARAPHPVLPGHDVRNAPLPPAATSLLAAPGRNGVAPLAAPPTNSTCLPNPTLPGRPASPCVPSSRPYPTPSIGSSHVNSSLSSSNHNHSLPYQSQSSLQKHSVQSVYTSRPPHLAPFSVANHIQPLPNQTTAATHASHPMNSHSILNHTSHLHNSITTSTPNHIGQLPPVVSTASSAIPNYASSLKHSGLGLPLHPSSNVPPVSLHTSSNHIDSPATTSAAAVVTSSSILSNSHPLAPPVVDSRQPPSVDSRQPPVIDSRQPPIIDSRQPSALDSRQPSVIDSRQPPIIDSRLPPVADSRQPPVIDSRQPVLVDSRQPSVVESRQAPVSSSELPVRTESPAIASIASNGFPPPAVYSGAGYPPLYAPYATTLQHSPYLPPAAASPRNSADTRTSLSASPLVAPKTPKGVRPHTPGSTGGAAPHSALSYSPRESPSRERESFSSISSLSRGTATATAAVSLPPPLTPHAPPLATSLSSSLVSPLVGPLAAPLAAPTPTPAAAPTSHLAHSLAPVPTVPSISSSAKPPAHWGVTRPTAPDRPGGFAPAPPLFGAPLPPPNPNPFSAESLFQSSPGADLLRRELDNRFLAAAGAGAAARTELHHHQHQHTHVHQHPHHGHAPHATHPAHAAHAAHAPHPPPAPHHHQLLMPHGPLFKDVGKMSSLYRAGLGLGYPYSSSLLHPAAPYVPPAPLTTFAPKPVVSAASDPATKPPPRPAVAKTGKWNAMHVRIAWEIYNHQQKEKTGGSGQPAAALAADKDKLRAFPAPAPPPPFRSPYDLPPAPYLPHHPHLGVSPFGRYAGAFPGAPAAFGLSPYGRELLSSPLHHGVHHAPPLSLHDAWRVRPAPAPAPAPQPDVRRDIDERARRDREERERRDREERERRKQRERDLDRVRVRSPLRNGVPEPPKDERKEMPRAPPTLGAYPPAAWDPYRAAFDPLQHMRFAPLVEAAIRAEEDRAKMFSAYAHHQQLKAGPLLHRGLPPHGPLPPLGVGVGVGVGAPHGSLAPLPALPHAPLPPHAQLPALGSLHPHAAPLDLLKKEEPR